MQYSILAGPPRRQSRCSAAATDHIVLAPEKFAEEVCNVHCTLPRIRRGVALHGAFGGCCGDHRQGRPGTLSTQGTLTGGQDEGATACGQLYQPPSRWAD